MRDWSAFVRGRLGGLQVRPEREAEIVAELSLQMDQAFADAIAAGASETEAARRAEAQFGGWEKLAGEIEAAEHPAPVPPEYREGFFTGAWYDVRFALRSLRKNPGFAAIAVATLAFGIGGNTAIFTMVDALVLRDLPYRDPGRLIAIETRRTDQPEIEPWTSAPDFYDFRERARSFSALAALSPVWSVVLTGKGNAQQLDALYVSADFFPMLGVNAALGSTFTRDEDQRGKTKPVAVLGYGFWQRRFGGRRDVIGQSLTFDGAPFTVIGVLPPGFRWAGEPLSGPAVDISVWLPMAANPLTSATPRSVRYMKVVGQRRRDVTLAQARDEIRRVTAGLAAQYPDFDRGYEADGRPLSEQVTGKTRTGMLLLLGMVGFVLLMACANVANLLLARATARSREITIRIAVGASAFRLVRQLLTEGLVLSVLGGALGIPLAYAGVLGLVAVGPDSLFHPGETRLDLRALAFTSAAVLLCAIFAGLPPAWRVARPAIAGALRESGRGLTAGHHHVRAALVIVQVAAALVLLVGAGLLIRSFQQLLGVQPGFDSHNLITIATQLPSGARTPGQRRAVYERIRESLMAQPGVSSVAAISRMPFMGKNLGTWVYVEGKDAPGAPGVEVEYRVATASYFETMGVPLRAGRLYDQRDDGNPGAVVVINEAMARRLWPGQEAVGKRIKMTGVAASAPWITVIGVVGNVRHFGLEADPRAELYRPYPVNPLGAPILAIRTRSDPAALLQALSARVRAIDPAIPTYNEFVMEKLVARSTMQRRFVMLLLAGFAAAALLLAGLGIYGTMSQAVAQRTQEIGVRIALGASPAEVLRLVIGEGARLMLVGVAMGAVAAAALAGLMRTMLFEVRPLDPFAFAGAVATLAVFALAACYFPARRATRVDPMVALRDA